LESVLFYLEFEKNKWHQLNVVQVMLLDLESDLCCLLFMTYYELFFLSILFLIHAKVYKYSFSYTHNSYKSSYNPWVWSYEKKGNGGLVGTIDQMKDNPGNKGKPTKN